MQIVSRLALPSLVVLLACSSPATPSGPPPPPAPAAPPTLPTLPAAHSTPLPRVAPPIEPSDLPPMAPLPRVMMRPSTTTGPLNSDAIHPVLLRDLASFRHCYQLALDEQPTLGGAITVRFTIHAAGNVTDATAVGAPGLENVATCVQTIVSREHYRSEAADTTVELPMTVAPPLPPFPPRHVPRG